jgi:hypothetical protein
MTKLLERKWPLLATASLALALAAGVLAGTRNAGATGTSHADMHTMHMAMKPASGMTRKQLAFHDAMRKLWEDHITWTRLAIVDLAAGAPSTNATVARLLANQKDIGNAIKPYYGSAAGAKLTALLREHILIAADVIAAAKTANEAGLTSAQQRWTKNANAIAAFLHGANPNQWSLKMLRAMVLTHLDLTTREAVSWLNRDWPASITAYENVHAEILQMADMLSAGIEKQFPRRFR